MMLEEFLRRAKQSAPYSPCIGSGFCCKKVLCWEAHAVHPMVQRGPCPSLRFHADLNYYVCGVYEDAEGAEKERIAKSLGIGAGCCSNLNSDRIPVLQRLKEEMNEDRHP